MFQTSIQQHNGAKYFLKFKIIWKVIYPHCVWSPNVFESLSLSWGANSNCLFLLFFLNSRIPQWLKRVSVYEPNDAEINPIWHGGGGGHFYPPVLVGSDFFSWIFKFFGSENLHQSGYRTWVKSVQTAGYNSACTVFWHPAALSSSLSLVPWRL